MTKTKSTKRALLSSVLALVLCLTMLVGSTFAWFTDTASTGINKIVSGKLDIALYKIDISEGPIFPITTETEITDSSAPLFAEDILWEPGYEAIANLKLVNKGNLALKWQAVLRPTSEVGKLAEVIDVYTYENEDRTGVINQLMGREHYADSLTFVGTLKDVLAGKVVLNGALEENEDLEYFSIVLKMREDAGNEYQDKTAGEFDITIFATQYTYENDSFDNQYDKFADYDGEISNAVSLAAAFKNGGTYKVTSDIAVDDVVAIPEGKEVVLNLNGNTLSKSVDNGIVVRNYGKLTLSGNGTIDGTIGGYAVRTEPGSELTINEGIVVDGGFGAVSCFGGKLTINGGDFSNEESNTTHYVVYATNNSTVVINGGTFTFGEDQYAGANGSPILAATNGTTMEINGGTFDATGKSALCYNANNIVIKGGTFKNRATVTYGGTIEDKVADGYEAIVNGDGSYTVSMTQAKAKEAILAAANSGTPVTLPAGNYTMPGDDIRGKSLTIKGTKDTVIDVSAIDANNQFVTGSTVVFDGVTLKFNESDSSKLYMGFANTASLTYKNCHITGLQILYGDKVTFENCVIDSSANTMGQPHSVWTYGAKNVTFTDCDFIYGHRAINCYKDQDIDGGKQVVNFKNCTFTTTDVNSEGAVEINSSPFSVGIEVNMEGCTAPKYGPMAYVSPWDSTNGAKTTINIK